MKQIREKAPLYPDHPDWQSDDLGKFIASADYNTHYIFEQHPNIWLLLSETDKLYNELTGNLDATPYTDSMLFLTRSYNTFQGAARLLISTQFVEVHALLRSMLEHCLCALYFRDHPEKFEVWLKRHESEEERKKARSVANNTNMLKHLKTLDEDLGTLASEIYDDTIDYGAHPNPMSMIAGYLGQSISGTFIHSTVALAGDTNPYFLPSVVRFIEGSLCCISIGCIVFPSESKHFGVDAGLKIMKARSTEFKIDLGSSEKV